MRSRPLAYVSLLIAILIWGFAYVVTKSGLDAVPPMMFALLRYAVASLLLVPLALARGGLAALFANVTAAPAPRLADLPAAAAGCGGLR